jgi:cytochrome c oxidase subunit 2
MWNQLFPERASTIANDVDLIFAVVLGLSILFAVPVAICVITFALRYRGGKARERYIEPHEGRGGTWKIEAGVIAGLLVLALTVFGWGASVYLKIYAMPADAMNVYVVAKQWMWKFQHPTGQTEIDELHVPVGFPVRLTMISEDVIHSFFVPAFRVKRDVVPGEYTTVWFQATETGTFNLFCAEYCGTDHSRMLARVVVMDATAYQAWISQRSVGGGTGVIAEGTAGTGSKSQSAGGAQGGAQSGEQTPATMADAGGELFANLGCQSCHRQDGTGAGPSLVGVWGTQTELEGGQVRTVDEDYVRRSILDPHSELVKGYPPIMPPYEGQINEDDLTNLIEYVRSLGNSDTSGDTSTNTPSGGTPSSGTPSSGTPSSETPSSETPSGETPSSETPSSETPSSGTPISDTNQSAGGAESGAQSGEQTSTAMAAAGGELFTSLGCQSCHREDGAGAGPSLVGIWGTQTELEGGQVRTVDEDYVRRSILDPHSELVKGYQPIMPPYEGQINEDDLANLIEYVHSLGNNDASDGTSNNGTPSSDSAN